MKTFAVMPSNIALIKYMGKSDGNTPLNPSLSYTTPRFESYVEIEESAEAGDAGEDAWEELPSEQLLNLQSSQILKNSFPEKTAFSLSRNEADKFMKFFKALKGLYNIKRNFTVRSYNAFPSSCGLASSASSFAALTKACHQAFTGREVLDDAEVDKLSRLSQKGSGSSCRSFYGPWAIWEDKGARQAPLDIEVDHYVLIVEAEKKKVSSSEAHLRVLTSENFVGRADRAKKRLSELQNFLVNDWPRAFEICWAEFFDMHGLFETSKPPFGYMKPESLAALESVRRFWDEEGMGPLVTMDAGPNIHLLFRRQDEDLQDACMKRLGHYRIL